MNAFRSGLNPRGREGGREEGLQVCESSSVLLEGSGAQRRTV